MTLLHRITSLMGLIAVLAALSGLPAPVTVVSALTIGVFAAVFCHVRAALVRAAAAKAATSAAAARELSRHTAFLPQRDPDAAGRTRPRAPGQWPRGAGVVLLV